MPSAVTHRLGAACRIREPSPWLGRLPGQAWGWHACPLLPRAFQASTFTLTPPSGGGSLSVTLPARTSPCLMTALTHGSPSEESAGGALVWKALSRVQVRVRTLPATSSDGPVRRSPALCSAVPGGPRLPTVWGRNPPFTQAGSPGAKESIRRLWNCPLAPSTAQPQGRHCSKLLGSSMGLGSLQCLQTQHEIQCDRLLSVTQHSGIFLKAICFANP